jgi:hypothetical protein
MMTPVSLDLLQPSKHAGIIFRGLSLFWQSFGKTRVLIVKMKHCLKCMYTYLSGIPGFPPFEPDILTPVSLDFLEPAEHPIIIIFRVPDNKVGTGVETWRCDDTWVKHCLKCTYAICAENASPSDSPSSRASDCLDRYHWIC